MHRRSFLKNTLLTSTGLLLLPVISFSGDEYFDEFSTKDELEKGFFNPPFSARPQAYWMWMNGHITKKGIQLDLIRMKLMGLAGAYIYNTNIGIPEGPIKYGSEEWMDLFMFAVEEAKKLGLEIFMHNSPGFSSTGGPEVLASMGMQQLVWSESIVNSNGLINIQLPQPLTKLNYYNDSFAIAYPSLPVEQKLMKDAILKIVFNDNVISKSLLHQGNKTPLLLQGKPGSPAYLIFEFTEPYLTESISIWRSPKKSTDVNDTSFDYPPEFLLEASADGKIYKEICKIQMPPLRSMTAPGTEVFTVAKAKFFRLSTTQETHLTAVELHSSARLKNWAAKMNFTDQDLTADNRQIPADQIIDPATVIDISNHLTKNGRLTWNAPPGRWTILRIGHTTTGATNVSAPPGATGLEIDKFSSSAVDFYFKTFLVKLFDKLKGYLHTTFKGILIDSWEVGKQNWSSDFSFEFTQRCKYDLRKWLPAVTGRIVNNVDDTENFLWDVRRIQADLVAESYYGTFHKHCKQLGISLSAEPNGDGVFDSLQVAQYLHTPMAEFWTRYVPGTLNICKEAVSASHIYGQKVAAAEAFTGMPFTSRWTGYPYAFKSQADHIFSIGINKLVLHVFVHQPYTTGLPGMTMGQWGSHFDRNQTWSKYSHPWIKYLTRTQFLLQQGTYVADVCYYKGEDPASGIPDINYVNPPIPKEIAGDVIGPDALMKTFIKDNRINLPCGMSYRLMILAPVQKISPGYLQKIRDLVSQGMVLVVSSKPQGSIGLKGMPPSKHKVTDITNDLWGSLNGIDIKQQSFGKGKIYWNTSLNEIFEELNIKPNFLFSSHNPDAAIHSTYRRSGNIDIFFVSNHLRRSERIIGSFLVKGKFPEIWNCETGEISRTALYEISEDRVIVPFELEPSGSLFIIFRYKENANRYSSISKDGEDILSTSSAYPVPGNQYSEVVNNFTVSVWIKPDTYAIAGKGIIIFPPEGESLYGAGHAACGLAAGQNAIRIFEREKGPNRDSIVIVNNEFKIEGWTHVVVRYSNGTASLFINGQLIESGKPSGKKVHPGLDNPPTDEFFSAAFEGNSTKPILFKQALADQSIFELFKTGLPSPTLPTGIEVCRLGKLLKTHIWSNGTYHLKGERNIEIETQKCKTIPIEPNWRVSFPPGSGAPSSITMNNLISLHLHNDFGVRHFSGTATYIGTFQFSDKLMKEHRVILDLGRVETMAEVYLNKKKLDVLWKEPFRVDISKAIIVGENNLEVRVTSLWPNRMIGDEYLPKENEYDANGFIKKFPDWFLHNRLKEGQRITFSSWNNFRKDNPLLASGLLGPVTLILGIEHIICD